MPTFRFGRNSTKNLNEVEKDLQLIFRESLLDSPFDFGVHEGHRPVAEQQALYAQGRTTPGEIVTFIDGVNKKSAHNYSPSRAVDIHVTIPGRKDLTWDKDHILVIAGVIIATANRLYREGKTKHVIRWGGNWDRDQIIVTKDENERFFDPIHFELATPNE